MALPDDNYYPVVAINMSPQPGASPLPTSPAAHEPLGGREKTWILRGDEEHWLFKKPRPTNPGEAWAEKVAAEIAHALAVPCAVVELAKSGNDLGTISRSFLPSQWPYYHGNSVLANFVADYDLHRKFGQSGHSIKNIVGAIRKLGNDRILDPELAMSTLAAYAILDGVIGNTDRHHENWMIALSPETLRFEVAPSYDHASSMGRELQDSRRLSILDEGRMLNYIRGGRGKKGKGRVYTDANRRIPLSPLQLAQLICRWQPGVAQPVLERLRLVTDSDFRAVIHKVPPEFMSDIAKDFACQFLIASKSELLRSIR